METTAAPTRPPDLSPELRANLDSRIFQGLSDPSRVLILELLLDGERNVSELMELTGMPQSRLSNHLACLRTCGFATTRRDGKFIYYRVIDQRVRDLLDIARSIVRDNAEQILACQVVR